MRKRRTPWEKILRRIDGQTAGVLGDFMLDELLQGSATRLAPEAPVPVVQMDAQSRRDFSPGGAGNVAANLQALGARAIPFGAIGKDESGKQLLRELQALGVPCGTLVREAGRVTPYKLRVAADHHQMLRLDFESPAPISRKTSALLVRSFARWAPKLKALIISDYRKGSVQNELCNQVSALARQRRIPVFVDPTPDHPEICRHATAVTSNLREAEMMAGRPMRDRARFKAAGRQLLAFLDCVHLVISHEDGMTLFEKGGRTYEIAGVPVTVSGARGVQDTVIAVLALAFCAGAEMREAAEFANFAAGQAERKFGTSRVGRSELFESIAARSD